jgi:hypothetical protein
MALDDGAKGLPGHEVHDFREQDFCLLSCVIPVVSQSCPQQHLAFNFYRDAKRQFGHANCAACMSADLRAKHFKDQVGEAIDDSGLAIEAGCRVDHAEDVHPGLDTVQTAQLALETAQDRQRL